MPQQDLKNNISVVHLGNLSLSGTTPDASDWVDTRGYDSCTLVAINNTVGDAGTAAGYSFVVQEGDDTTAAGASAVADAELIGLESALTVTADDADHAIAGYIGYVGNSRYVRLNVTGTTGTDADVSVIAILGHVSRRPSMSTTGTSVAAT